MYRPPQLVVCCRVDEYASLATRLRLNGAVRLLPLSNQQIQDHLAGLERPWVWEGLRDEMSTLELALFPLLLDLMASIGADDFQKARVEDAATSATSRLFDSYVEAVLTRDHPTGRYSSDDARRWLAQLASTLARQGESRSCSRGCRRPGFDRAASCGRIASV